VLLITVHEGGGLWTLTKRAQLFPSQNNILQHQRRSETARDLHREAIVTAPDWFPYRNALQRVGTGTGNSLKERENMYIKKRAPAQMALASGKTNCLTT
jgi:hypothetical protein